MKLTHLFCAALLATSGAVHANVTVFADNFDANALGLNAVPTGWSVTDGTVDVIGTGFYDFIPGSGHYIDLDGSTGNAGVLGKSLNLSAGTVYTATFDLAGNHRNGDAETVRVLFGSSSDSHGLPMNAGWTSYSLSFTPSSSGAFSLSFENSGGDNIGMLLDNVKVTAVPEPQTYALLALGLAVVGGAVRRRTVR